MEEETVKEEIGRMLAAGRVSDAAGCKGVSDLLGDRDAFISSACTCLSSVASSRDGRDTNSSKPLDIISYLISPFTADRPEKRSRNSLIIVCFLVELA